MKSIKRKIGPNKIPPSLPLLDYLETVLDLEKNKPFKGFSILAVQHLLGSSLPLFTALEKGGANPKDIYLVGKAYSSHPLVVQKLIDRGYHVTFDEVFSYREDQPYDSILKTNILAKCCSMFESDHFASGGRGLIIDDGGKAIKLLLEQYSSLSSQFKCVEQTSRGARLLETKKLTLPVINVARSDAKTIHESPSIGMAMVKELMSSLKRWRNSKVFVPRGKRTLVLGYGFVGKCVVEELLKLDFVVSVFDPLLEQKNIIVLDPRIKVCKSRLSAYKDADIIVGCSGTQSIPREEFKSLKDHTLLVNMASTDIEFGSWNFRSHDNIVHLNILQSDEDYLNQYSPMPWRALYRVKQNNTYFYIANGGFPSDFSGTINPVPSEKIQLTTALLLAAAVQATNSTDVGLIDLNQKIQSRIIKKYLKLQKLK